MKVLLTISLCILFAFSTDADCQKTAQISPEQSIQNPSSEIVDFIQQFKKPENLNILQGALWTLTHDYADAKQMKEVLGVFQSYFEALAKYENKDITSLEKLGGINSFKDKSAEWLKYEDQAIRAFAAVFLGISGDKKYAPQIAVLLKERKYEKEPLIIYDRGRAAMSLGLLGANNYLPEILRLLKSKNQFDRQGAIYALGYFGAKEYSKDVAAILTNKEFQFDDDSSPIFFLVESGTAQNYKKELIKVMLGEFRSETSEAAMYALVSLNAKEAAPEIAKLLKDQFKKGDAAKALALLDAKELTDEIALLLKDESSLVRSDAATALGVLQAKKYAGEVAKLFNDKESFVHNYAATSILLMEATEYYKTAVPIVEKPFAEKAYLTDSAFHPLVADQSRQITERLQGNFQQAKSVK